MTPVVSLEEDLSVKLDYCMPTLSFKDRGAAVLAARYLELGVDRVLQDSSGNAGNSVAAYCARAGIGCEIYVPEGTSARMIRAHGATVHVIPGSRDHCAAVCRDRVREEKIRYASHVFDPFFYEGTKTWLYEVYEQLGRVPKTLFLPVGNGTLFLGVMKALEEFMWSGILPEMPQVVAFQSEKCDPVAQALRNRRRKTLPVEAQPTLAEGIAVGNPLRGDEILEYIYRYQLRVITAPESEIETAREMLAKQGMFVEPTAAAGLAAYRRHCREYGRPAAALLSLPGAGLKSEHGGEMT